MATLPTQIQIGPYRYRLTVDGDRLDERDLDGEIRYRDQEIVLREDYAKDRQAADLLHEVIHGILEQAGYDTGPRIESFVTILAPGLLDTLRRNPELSAYLLATDSDG